jgi:hypothetical protein
MTPGTRVGSNMVYPDSILVKLEDIAEDFDGIKVVEAGKLQQSWLAPAIFAGKAKQARQAVGALTGEAYIVAKWNKQSNKYVPYPGDPKLPQAKYLVKVEYLLNSPTIKLVDPLITRPRGRLSAWLNEWLEKWRTPDLLTTHGLSAVADPTGVPKEDSAAESSSAALQEPTDALEEGASCPTATEEPTSKTTVTAASEEGPTAMVETTDEATAASEEGPTAMVETTKEATASPATAKASTPRLGPQPLILLDPGESVLNGIPIPFTFRGQRSYEGLHIRAADVGAFLGTADIVSSITNSKSALSAGLHYNLISLGAEEAALPKRVSGRANSTCRAEVYLTMSGFTRLLHRSNKPTALQLTEWIAKLVYVHNGWGSQEEKVQLAAELMGFPLTAVRQFVNGCCARKLSATYFMALGPVGKLRESLDFDPDHHLPDDYIVYKYGLSEDYYARSGKLQMIWEKFPGVSMHLKLFTYVDKNHLHSTETRIKHWFEGINVRLEVGVRCDGHTELVVLSPSPAQVAGVKELYRAVGLEYGQETNNAIRDSAHQVDKLKVQLASKDEQIASKEQANSVVVKYVALLEKQQQ